MEVSSMPPRNAVLVIDVEPMVRELLRAVLEDAGHPVQMAPDLTVGLEVLRASPVPLVVLFDVVPRSYRTGDTGADLLAALEHDAQATEEHSLSRHAYVMMSTSPQEALAQAEAFPPGVLARVLEVPFRLAELRATIEQASGPQQPEP
jgi:CheY-like chemotaxis protein